MPDTGAPFNIPFAEGSNLVRDWPALSEDVADAVAAGLSIGLGTNVVQTVKQDVFTTTSTSFTALTGASVTITPSSNTSKVLLIATFVGATTSGTTSSIGIGRFMRDSTAIALGTAVGSRSPATFGISTRSAGQSLYQHHSANFLDSPTSAVAVTYSIEVLVGAGTLFIGRNEDDTDAAAYGRFPTILTAIEVAA